MGLTLEEANRILRGVIARHRRLLLNLKARYAALCDAQYDADGIAMLFKGRVRCHGCGARGRAVVSVEWGR